MYIVYVSLFFFFKQKTAYEMRISDWSSDVCSSDLALRDEDYPTLNEDSVFRLLVTGGSQGATILSSVVPEGLGLLPISLRRRLQVTQQCRVEDIDKVRAVYAELDRKSTRLNSSH